ncbi:MAG: hypothetical protein ACLP8S_00060 [Solirubrobacteraceae bacterium]
MPCSARPARTCPPGSPDERRAGDRVAGIIISLGVLVALAAAPLVSHPSVPASFRLLATGALCSGVGCIVIPWDRLSPWWLQPIPVLATTEVALGVWLAGVYGNIASSYYVFVALFAAYAFSSRAAIAVHVMLASAAMTLPLPYLRSDGG